MGDGEQAGAVGTPYSLGSLAREESPHGQVGRAKNTGGVPELLQGRKEEGASLSHLYPVELSKEEQKTWGDSSS